MVWIPIPRGPDRSGHGWGVPDIIGPRPARKWLDSLFSDLYVQEVAGGGTGSDAAHRRLLFIQSLQASAVRSTDFAFR